MAARKHTPDDKTTISNVLQISSGRMDCCILGTSPFYCNRMSEKARHQLLMPSGRKTATERATTQKHDPRGEFRASPYILHAASAPTLLALLSVAFKRAMESAALDMPGMKSTQIGRLTFVDEKYTSLYGIPKLAMDNVKQAGMTGAPDVRTRAILPEWAVRMSIKFIQPLIQGQAVANLLAAAGLTIGVGDWRQQKGAGSFGQFRIVDADDADFKRVIKEGGRAAQAQAMEQAIPYDDETAELLEWYDTELAARKLKGVGHAAQSSTARALAIARG